MTPHTLVLRLYELVSGPAGQERPWRDIRALFRPDARLHSVLGRAEGEQAGHWSVDEFIAAAAADYRQRGFWERELTHRIEQYGHIAQIWSTYEARSGPTRDGPVTARGINGVQCLRESGRWAIASIVFQMERPELPIPDER